MDNQKFDNRLREIESGAELPFDEAQWRLMTRRLDSYEKGQKAVPLWVHTSSAVRWGAAAAVVVVALVSAWFMGRDSKSEIAEPAVAVETPRPVQSLSKENTITIEENLKRSSAQSIQSTKQEDNRGILFRGIVQPPAQRPAYPSFQKTEASAPVAIVPQKQAEDPLVEKKEVTEQREPFIVRKEPQAPQVHRIEEPFEMDPPTAPGKTAFDINGGYGGGVGAKNSFALGVAVKRSIGQRLEFQAGIGVVSGEYNTNNIITVATTNVGTTGNPIGPTPIVTTTTEQAEEEITERIAYMQAAPSFTYRVVGGLAIGGGVDAQRRISGASKSDRQEHQIDAYTSVSTELGPQPDWDFGLTARADYNLSKRLRLGVMYRESVGTTSTTSKKAAGRNYMLVQLGFKLF